MSGPFGSSQWMYQSARDFYEFPLEQSLKFNDDDSSYLSWTPASAGNRKTWTWSGWVKRGNISLSAPATLFSAGTGGSGDSARLCLQFKQDDTLITDMGGIGQYNQSNSVYRDTSAWYHIVWKFDVTQSTAADRSILYVNGERISDQNLRSFTQNADHQVNAATVHRIGALTNVLTHWADLYLAEVNFIDGQALDPTSFGEFKSGVWIPKDPSGLTYGTNGFRLSFQNDTVSEGFNTVTYSGTSATHAINGIGFEPDFVWIKARTGGGNHYLTDAVRGTTKGLQTNLTASEVTNTDVITSFNSDGFTLGTDATSNNANISGRTYVAWCWDAGSGSAASNTDGSITSNVKANPDYGFSIVGYTGNGSTGATVGHGLNSAPEMLIVKNRDISDNWAVYHSGIGATHGINLNATTAAFDWDRYWNDTAPTSSVFTVGGPIVDAQVNGNGNDIIAYAFHSVTNYSKVGSYTGNGSTQTITTGFKPAFLLVRNATLSGVYWAIYDNTRDTQDPNNKRLFPNVSNAEESSTSVDEVTFTSTGFTVNSGGTANQNGATIIYYAVADTRDNAFWRDQSGNGNDWQPNNLTYQDSLPDSTTNNFAVLNPVIRPYTVTSVEAKSEGNLKISNTGSGVTGSGWATFNVNSGKWYYETVVVAAGGNIWIGWSNDATKAALGTYTAPLRDYGYTYKKDGNKCNNSATGTSYGASYTTGDIIGVALDIDAGTLEFYKNGVSQGVAFTGVSANGGFTAGASIDPATTTVVMNFGQDSSFAGNKPAQGNTDDNGIGDFYHPVPSGYLALAASNLPNPTIDPAQDDVPSDYFNTVAYSGNSTERTINVGFQPDFTWIKTRSRASNHNLVDAVRGVKKLLSSNNTDAELTEADTAGIDGFVSNGFTLEDATFYEDVNVTGQTYVAWNWLAGNGTSSNTDGSITSTVSVNQKAGFSVVSWTGNGSANQTAGHGLGVKPKLKITKSRSISENWVVTGELIGGTDYRMFLNSTAANGTAAGYYPADTSTTIGLSGTNVSAGHNQSGATYVSYVFAEVEGYSKFGSYTGNGSSDGPMIFTGHAPAWVMVKRTDSADDWSVWDNERGIINGANYYLNPNLSNAEVTGYQTINLLSNGFKITNTDGKFNASGGTYIYASFAEMPFRYSNAR